MKQIGVNPSAIDGQLLRKNDRRILKHGDTIELVHGLFKHTVLFDPPPPRQTVHQSVHFNEKESAARKASRSHDLPEPSSKKQRLSENVASSSSELVCQENTWESIDNGRLLIFTSKGTEHSSKVCIVLYMRAWKSNGHQALSYIHVQSKSIHWH